MHFECRSKFYPKPYEPDNYISPFDIFVHCNTDNEDMGERVITARLAVDYLNIARAESEGANICHVCDADSSGWEYVFSATIEAKDDFAEIRDDFGFADPVNGLLFLHHAVFYPSLRDWQAMIVDGVCQMFPNDTAIVMWKDATNMIPRELADLGFRMVAESNLLFRPNMLNNPYSAAEDQRDPMSDLVVPVNAEDCVFEHWDAEEDPDRFER